MGFTFVYTNDYSVGIEQMIALLGREAVRSHVTLSKYSFIELAHLRFYSLHEDAEKSRRASELMEKDMERIVADVVASAPDAVGFSLTTDTYLWGLSLAGRIKKALPSCPIIMGGAHPSVLPERVIAQPCVDAVFVDESDTCIADVFNALSGKSGKTDIPGLWLKRGDGVVKNPAAPLVQDLDSLPFKDIGPFVAANPNLGKMYNVMATRGCPFRCSYCVSGNNPHGSKFLRRRSVENVLAELDEAKAKYPLEKVGFLDDVFIMDHKWLREFLPEYKTRIGLPYICLIHPNYVKADILQLMQDSGCVQVKCGIQTVNPTLSKNIYNRDLNLDKVRRVIREIKEYDMTLKVDFIIGAPTETEQDLIDLIELIKELDADDLFLYYLQYFPGTRIIRFALDNGHITEEEYEAYLEGREMAYQFVPERFQGEKREMYMKYYKLIRDAAGSNFSTQSFAYLLE